MKCPSIKQMGSVINISFKHGNTNQYKNVFKYMNIKNINDDIFKKSDKIIDLKA